MSRRVFRGQATRTLGERKLLLLRKRRSAERPRADINADSHGAGNDSVPLTLRHVIDEGLGAAPQHAQSAKKRPLSTSRVSAHWACGSPRCSEAASRMTCDRHALTRGRTPHPAFWGGSGPHCRRPGDTARTNISDPYSVDHRWIEMCAAAGDDERHRLVM